MRRELDAEKIAARDAIASADRARDDALTAGGKLAELKEQYAKDKENSEALQRQLSQTLAAEKAAAVAAKERADQGLASVKQVSRFRYVMCRMLELFSLRTPLDQYLYPIETWWVVPTGGWEPYSDSR